VALPAAWLRGWVPRSSQHQVSSVCHSPYHCFMPIRRLPPLLVNQIAAGEVIERPASVVKELVENSLDAGATRIDVAVEQGGRTLIRIADNGKGIPPDELPLAIAPHATSKIESAQDLEAICTLGFRGEALASIASVSRLRLASRPTVEGSIAEEAHVIEVSGDQISHVAPIAGSPGTVIEVRDLFFNTPARRKFMRTDATEIGHISDIIQRIAIVHPHVGFTLTHNDRKSLDLPATDSRRQRCIDILGREIEDGLLEFEQKDTPEQGNKQIWGLAALPKLARGNSKYQYICINGRPVRDRNLQHALKEAYRGLMPPEKQPVAVVFIEMNPAEVDVNVHPTKAEVRFRQPSAIHGMVLTAIRQCLLGNDLTPQAQMPGSSDWRMSSPTGGTLDGLLQNHQRDAAGEPASADALSSAESTDDFVNYFRRMDPRQKGFVYAEVKKALAEESPELLGDAAEGLIGSGNGSAAEPSADGQAGGLRSMPILQVHKSYVVSQDEQGLIIVDQHALHERVMFEELRQRVLGEGRSLESQRLLMPAVVQADARRQSLLAPLKPLLERIGIELEPIGPDAVAIQAFASFLFDRHVEPIDFVENLLDKAEEGAFDTSGGNAEESALHEVLDMMACKAAVKAGDQMSQSELAALLAKREQIERSSNCPHGRPTTLRLSLRDLEKQFGRS